MMGHLTEAEEKIFQEYTIELRGKTCSYRRQWLKHKLSSATETALWCLAAAGLAMAGLMACMTPGGARFIANLPRRMEEATS